MIESETSKPHTNSHFFWVWAIPVLIADQLTKQWIINNLRLNSSMYPVESWQPYLRWSHVANTGGIFGMFQGTTLIFSVLAGLVTLMIVWMNYSSPESTLLARGTYGLILGGALGNLIDRIRIGHVTDFIDIDLSSIIPIGIADWYVFNVADMAIIGGIITLLILSFVAPAKINLDG